VRTLRRELGANKKDMLTIFTTAKPFRGHSAIIQRNAIQSWKLLHPDVEVILFDHDEGAAEVCEDFELQHVRDVRKNKHGTKYLASIYDQAQEIARYDVLCHVNCDILLMSDFRRAVESVTNLRDRYLMAGRRWDVDIREPIDFQHAKWEERLRTLALQTNRQRPAQWIDYFVFPKGLYYSRIPEFVIGRPGWDNWLLWYARSSGVSLVDTSSAVCAIHQDHDYSYHPDGEKGVWEGEEAQENYRLLEGKRKFRSLEDATHILQGNRLRPNYNRLIAQAQRGAQRWITPIWFYLLNISRPLRHRIGLRPKART
jgi:hypothetical protein